MRIAVLADIHGNILALEAVLVHVAERKADLIVDLGDCASGPLWPRETLERLAALDAPTVRGNHDRWVGTLDPAVMGPSDRFAFDAITADQHARLRALPSLLHVAPDVVAFHATPKDDNLYLLDEIEGGRVVRGHRDRIAERLGPLDARLVLCGHSHRADIVHLPGGPLILNPGRGGCPALRGRDLRLRIRLARRALCPYRGSARRSVRVGTRRGPLCQRDRGAAGTGKRQTGMGARAQDRLHAAP